MSHSLTLTISALRTALIDTEDLRQPVNAPVGSLSQAISQLLADPAFPGIVLFGQKSCVVAANSYTRINPTTGTINDVLGGLVALSKMSLLIIHNKSVVSITLRNAVSGVMLPFIIAVGSPSYASVSILPGGVFVISMPNDQAYTLTANSSFDIVNASAGSAAVDVYIAGLEVPSV
jgi:hypothetical protein